MPKKKYPVTLSAQERKELEAFVSRGKRSAREITRARMLLLADEGKKDADIVQLLGVSRGTVHNVRKQYCQRAHEPIVDVLNSKVAGGRSLEVPYDIKNT
jgi:hypothetical protein